MRIAVMGAGVMGQNHCRVVRALGHDLEAVIDPVAGQEVARRHGAPRFATLEDARKAGRRPDAVIVATPTATHESAAQAALEAGAHVLVEKPLAPDAASAGSIVRAARQAGRVLAVGHVERHNPVVARVREDVRAGRYGAPIVVSARRVSNLPGRIRDVGCVLDLAIHDVDVVSHLVGRVPDTVFALGGSRRAGAGREDHATILLRFPGGVHGVVEANWLTARKVRQLVLTCESAYVECDYMDQSLDVSRSRFVPGPVPGEGSWDTQTERVPITRDEPLRREVADFVAAIQERRAPVADGEAGVAAVAVAQAALRSLASGAPERPQAAEAPA